METASTSRTTTTTTTTTNKQRTPSRCKEWERQRRLKFNDAMSTLGELVKSVNKANSNVSSDNANDNIQYAKIEIVHKAIICLTNCVEKNTQLKAEILALEVKLEAIEVSKRNRKDVSLQVMFTTEKKNRCSKSVKLMLQKDKPKTIKEKIIIGSLKSTDKSPTESKPKSLPKLLPLCNGKKENTIVMLPATPYIFPQRPVLFPTVPPTIVLVDANLQALNRSTPIPFINRNSNDITKTTMVNVLPISAYSQPLSAKKHKKNNSKYRNNTNKKNIKKSKTEKEEKKLDDTTKESLETDAKSTKTSGQDIQEKVTTDNSPKTEQDNLKTADVETDVKVDSGPKPEKTKLDKDIKVDAKKIVECNSIDNKSNKNETVSSPSKSSESIHTATNNNQNKNELNTPTIVENPVEPTSVISDSKTNKAANEKTILCEHKHKENKLQNILDPAICENVVDAGNARLELAEEFLAASPTAAFLMSFPLVSGNRADSPAEEPQITPASKTTNQRIENPPQSVPYFEKPNSPLSKPKTNKTESPPVNKNADQDKYQSINKPAIPKTNLTSAPNICNDNPFINLPVQTNVTSGCPLPDPTFGLEFDCNINKTATTLPSNYVSSNNLFYKSDALSSVKSTIYSTSSISSGHEFNSLGLYPCAVDNYTSKNKNDYNNADDALMKINSSRLTYDIDLGWSHKGLDFVNCTTTNNTFHKDNMLNTTATAYSTAYNPFNADFHVPLVSNANKKNVPSKPSTFPDPITSFYPQSTALWSEDIPNIYTYSNVSKNFTMKQQNYTPIDHVQATLNSKANTAKQYDAKAIPESTPENILKTPTLPLQHNMSDKCTKKSPNKMHINWMTSEVRPMQNNCHQTQAEIKQSAKLSYSQHEHIPKKPTNESSYLPINMHHFPAQPHHEDLQVWPAPRPAGTTEITIEPPPINLPTLVGDLALGPHDRKKNDLNRVQPQADLQNCSNFFSVTQLMNRSSENVPSRSNGPINEVSKLTNPPKQVIGHAVNDSNRKINTRLESNPQHCYVFNETKIGHSYDNSNQYSQNKSKPNKSDKSSKVQKNSYSAEALIRGGTCSQKLPDNNAAKYLVPTQKYNDFNLAQDTGVAQVSHFPSILDYADNNYTGQQFSGTTLYNSTTNTISNSFYSNFMPGSSNLMASNYTGGPFTSDFSDYNQSPECNYTNHKYSDMKMRSNGAFHQDKESYIKSTRRESAAKHKLECSKKDSNKKYPSKRAKLNHEVDEWNDTSNLLWQNKNPSTKRHPNIMGDEATFANYVGNQIPTQYQPEYFNSHLVPSNTQNIGTNGERSLSNFPVASRANFNLSALFPEITMKVQ